MKLFLSTIDREFIYVKVAEGDREVFVNELRGDSVTADSALGLIAQGCSENNIDLHHITEIEIIEGPGSFTGARIGVSIANAISLALSIPVNSRPIGSLATVQY